MGAALGLMASVWRGAGMLFPMLLFLPREMEKFSRSDSEVPLDP